MRTMLGELFLSWRLSLHLALCISRVCGHRWSKNMRFTAVDAPPPALCGMSAHGQRRTLFYHTPHNFHHIVRFQLRHWTADAVGPRAECVAASQSLVFPFPEKARRARRVLFGLDKFVRINVYVAKGTCMHPPHHTLLCKNFEKRKWFYGPCQFIGGGGGSPSAVNRQRPDPDGTGHRILGNECYSS